MVSVVFRQFGQYGIAAFLIQYRCAFSGTWSVRSCISMHVCLWLRLLVALINFPEGRDGSMDLILL